MGEKKIKQADKDVQLYTYEDVERFTTYSRKQLERFVQNGDLKMWKLNGGKRVTTKKRIIEFLNAISDTGPLEF